MSFRDWFVLTAAAPFLIAMGAVVTHRVWNRHQDMSVGAKWAVGESGSAGLQAFALPGTIAFALAWVGLLASKFWDPDKLPGGIIPVTLLTASICAMFCGFWIWLFMWPNFAIPPHLRDQPGWIAAAWQGRKVSREERRRRGRNSDSPAHAKPQ